MPENSSQAQHYFGSVRGRCGMKVMQLKRENQDPAAWGFGVQWQLISVYVSLLATEQIIYASCTCHPPFKNKDWTMQATIFNQNHDTVAYVPKLFFSIIVTLLKVLCSPNNWLKILVEFSLLTAFQQHLFYKKQYGNGLQVIRDPELQAQGPGWPWKVYIRLLPLNRVYFHCRCCHSRALGLCLASGHDVDCSYTIKLKWIKSNKTDVECRCFVMFH